MYIVWCVCEVNCSLLFVCIFVVHTHGGESHDQSIMGWTLPPYLSRRPHPTCWNGSCRYDRTIKREGDVLAPLEPQYYQTLNTGMTVTEARLPRLRTRSTRRFALCDRARCIFMTTIFVHAALPFWPIPSICRCIFYALHVRTRTITRRFCPREEHLLYIGSTVR